MEHIDKVKTIQFIRPNAEFTLNGDKLNWLDANQTEPTNKEIADGFAQYAAWKAEQEQAAVQAKAAAEAKLAALGLTTEDLKALGLGGN